MPEDARTRVARMAFDLLFPLSRRSDFVPWFEPCEPFEEQLFPAATAVAVGAMW
jgi:hypothetical protein